MKFLCDSHRKQMLQSPGRALKQWQVLMNHGTTLISHRRWKQALPLLGSSYEIAEWLLEKPEAVCKTGEPNYLDRYMLAASKLASCYRHTGYRDLELHVLLSSHRLLLNKARYRQSRHWAIKAHIDASVLAIQKFIDFYGPFRGHHDLVEESRGIMRQLCN